MPKRMRGIGGSHTAVVNSVSDTNAVSQVVTITYTGGQWVVTGSSTPGTLCAPTSGSAIDCGSPVQFNLTVTNSGTPVEGDMLDFAVLAASQDQSVQKKLYFGLNGNGYHNRRSSLVLDSTSVFHAVGQSATANPTLIDMLPGSGTYYTFVDSGAFTVQYATFTNMDNNGLQFTNSGPFSINDTFFDYAGNGVTSTSTFITINGVTNSTITLNNVYYGNSRLNVNTYNYMLSGTNTGLQWTNQYYSGPRAGNNFEYNDPSNKIRWGYHKQSGGMWHIMD